MPATEAPSVELGSAPPTPSILTSPSQSEISSTSSPEPQNIRAPPLFRVFAMPPPEPEQPPGQDELERRLPGYRRVVIPRELTLIELLKEAAGVSSDDEVLRVRTVKLRVIAERVGLRRLPVLAPRLRELTLDGSAFASLRDLGIGLVKLKYLSVNRCNLSSLDGVWGVGGLRELHAAGNKLQDLQPLAALQKLHTVNLADNPINDAGRLWTLGVCSALTRLTLRGTPASRDQQYRSRVASVLPMLVYLDDRPLNDDVDCEEESLLGVMSSSSDSEPDEDAAPVPETPLRPEPGPSSSMEFHELQGPSFEESQDLPRGFDCTSPVNRHLPRRPATAEVLGSRPERPLLPTRPHTARERRTQPLSRLHVMNTLMDDEWRCSGSSLTSRGAVCGNLAQALRRSDPHRRFSASGRESVIEENDVLSRATRALASEIPRAPILEDWERFKRDTGIDIDIDFTERPKGADPNKALDRLEQIERETKDRLKHEEKVKVEDDKSDISNSNITTEQSCTIQCELEATISDNMIYDMDMWREIEELVPSTEPHGEVDMIFNDTNSRRRTRRQ